MAFTDAEKVDIRRHCGYPMFGDQPTQNFGYRFMQHYQTLEFRLQHFSAEEETAFRKLLTDCGTLETAVIGSTANLDTAKAAVWTHNKNEVRDRQGLYDYSRKKLCDFIGIPPGPAFTTDQGVRVIV